MTKQHGLYKKDHLQQMTFTLVILLCKYIKFMAMKGGYIVNVVALIHQTK